MIQTVALMANGDLEFQIQTPTRVGETECGKYLVYEATNNMAQTSNV